MLEEKEFDPMRDVPENEKEVIEALRYGKSKEVANVLVGIFHCRVGRGDALLKAYEATLLAHVNSCK